MSTLLLDFDGTLNPGPYTTRYECNGVPTPEAKAAVKAYRDAGIEVIIFTARLSDGFSEHLGWQIVQPIRKWCREHFDGWKPAITCTKYPGVILDNNAIRFMGTWPTVEQIAGHGTFMAAEDYIPPPDYKQAFLDAMEIAETYWFGNPDPEIQRLRAMRDAAKGESNG